MNNQLVSRSVCPSICLSVCQSVSLLVSQSVCLSVSLSICLSVGLQLVSQSIRQSDCLSVGLQSVSPSDGRSFYLYFLWFKIIMIFLNIHSLTHLRSTAFTSKCTLCVFFIRCPLKWELLNVISHCFNAICGQEFSWKGLRSFAIVFNW